MERGISFLGIFVFIGLAYLMSQNRKAIQWRVVGAGLVLQVLFGILVLHTEGGRQVFNGFGKLVDKLLAFSQKGTDFVFGRLSDPSGPWSFVFAVKVLTTIIFFASLMNVLYYLGIMQRVIAIIARFIVKVMGTSGAETLCASANIFMGQTESPLLIRPYLEGLTRSELMTVMVTGFATLAAGVMFLYAGMLGALYPAAAGHLLAASIMSAPAAILMAKIIVPETEEPQTRGEVKVDLVRTESNVIEAAANGASTGLNLALNVAAMLIAFIAMIALVNAGFQVVGGLIGMPSLSLDLILGYVFAPLALMMGVPTPDLVKVGDLLGKNLVLNEFVSYSQLAQMLQDGKEISGRAVMVAIYAMCGFSNLSSIGIQIGGIGALAPGRKADLARLGMLALAAAVLANFQTAALASVLVSDSEVAITRPAGAPATPGAEATPGAAATPGASATPGELATPGASATPGAEATAGAAATPGVAASPGASPGSGGAPGFATPGSPATVGAEGASAAQPTPGIDATPASAATPLLETPAPVIED